jgi:hypothetical protein
MPKYLDMPEGNGESGAYQEFVAQIARGRAVAVVRVLDKSGGYSCYINSGDPTTKAHRSQPSATRYRSYYLH